MSIRVRKYTQVNLLFFIQTVSLVFETNKGRVAVQSEEGIGRMQGEPSITGTLGSRDTPVPCLKKHRVIVATVASLKS